MNIKTALSILTLLVALPLGAMAAESDHNSELARAFAPAEPTSQVLEVNDQIAETGILVVRDVTQTDVAQGNVSALLETSAINNSL